MWRLIKSWGIPIVLVVLFQFLGSRGLISDVRAPDLQGHLATGSAYEGLSAEKGPVLVYFWGSWCGICRAMQSTISAVASDHRVISVALRSGTPADVRRYQEEQGFNVPALADETGYWAEAYGVRGVPALFFVDSEGVVKSATTGFTSEAGIRLRLWRLGPGSQ